jgi:hypothetical protein
MEKLTLRAYRQKHKISFFNVMKMVKSGELKTISVEENGKEVEYILVGEQDTGSPENQENQAQNLKKMSLEEENKMLKEEVKRLREALEKCNRRTVLAQNYNA